MSETKPGDVYRLFFNPGEVVEIRALGVGGKSAAWSGWARGDGTVFGYFDNAEDFEKAAIALDNHKNQDGQGVTGIYFTPNLPKAELVARAKNRMIVCDKKKPTTGNSDIDVIRWLLIDLDPQRSAGISSTEEELSRAAGVGKKVVTFLEEEMGFPAGLRAHSGNGYHVCYRVPDLPNVPEISQKGGLINNVLQVLGDRFSIDTVVVDQVVYNAARIWKLYGTVGRKGDHTNERPHRRSRLFAGMPESFAEVLPVSEELLQKVADLLPKKPAAKTSANLPAKAKSGTKSTRAYKHNDLGELKVEEYLNHYGVGIFTVKPEGGSKWFCLSNCVFNESHQGGEAAIVQSPGQPYLTYHCFHTSCKGKTWRDARAVISGTEKITQFFTNYDPHWEPPTQMGSGVLNGIRVDPQTKKVSGVRALEGPDEIDPLEFYERRKNREAFQVRKLADYLAAWFAPIVCTDGQFYRYEGGVWRIFPKTTIRNVALRSLKERLQTAWIDNALTALADLVNREEKEWPS